MSINCVHFNYFCIDEIDERKAPRKNSDFLVSSGSSTITCQDI